METGGGGVLVSSIWRLGWCSCKYYMETGVVFLYVV